MIDPSVRSANCIALIARVTGISNYLDICNAITECSENTGLPFGDVAYRVMWDVVKGISFEEAIENCSR